MGDYSEAPHPRPPHAHEANLRAAYRALAHGCTFLIARETIAAPQSNAKTTLRRAGNCLRELDRLLCLLLDACAQSAAMPPATREAFERSHDAARKLRRIDTHGPAQGVDTARLHAIARLRRAASGETPGQPAHHNRRDLALAAGGRLGDNLTDWHLAQIARFYQAMAQNLYIYFATSANLLDFLREEADIEMAIVACDGI